MLGCIQPMSSPMMKRMLGFDCCCACAKLGASGKDANKSEAASAMSSCLHRTRVIVVLPRFGKVFRQGYGKEIAPIAQRRSEPQSCTSVELWIGREMLAIRDTTVF